MRYAIVGAVWLRYCVSTSTSPTRKKPSSSSVKWMRERRSRSLTGAACERRARQNLTYTLPPAVVTWNAAKIAPTRGGGLQCRPARPVGPPRRDRMRCTRRHLLKLSAAGAAAAALPLDVAPVLAQSGPVRLGILAAKAGVLAPVGESGLRGVQFATDRINGAGGR